MSPIIKFLILTCVICSVMGYEDFEEDETPWNKARQLFNLNQNQNNNRIRDRFMNGALRGRNSVCTGTRGGLAVEGVCRPLKECRLRGGVSAGTCALIGNCCIFERTCFNTTSAKLSYFVNPPTFQSQCSLTVNLYNRDVCQIRLDFDRFNIAPPTRPRVLVNTSYDCNNDSFTVNSGSNNLGFISLCGQNSQQHIYIPVNGTQGSTSITLNFQFATDRNTTNLQPTNPEWRIRIRQLECATQPQDFNNIQSYLQNMVQRLQNHKNNNIQNDAPLIAPAGCLQYFTERTGSYESFNYNNAMDYYIGRTNYAICFRRTPDVCGIRHTPVTFKMNYNLINGTEINCNPAETDDGSTPNNDYLLIPGGVFNDTVSNEYYCGRMIYPENPVLSTAPGPLYVVVRTDEVGAPAGEEVGFRINYQILSTGCPQL